jgi:hypothetical protein
MSPFVDIYIYIIAFTNLAVASLFAGGDVKIVNPTKN